MFLLSYFRDFLVVAALAAVMILVHAYERPLPPPVPAEMAAHDILPPLNKRRIEHIVLHTDSIGDIGFALSLPDPPPTEKMPVIMVLGGLGTGENNIRDITDAGNNIVAGYDWPMPVTAPKDLSFLLHTKEFYDSAMIAPAQIASAIDWLAAQKWADGNRVSLLGYSLGALAAPAAQNLTLQTGHIVGWTIIAYGGAPLSSILVADRHIQPFWMRYALAPFVSVFFHPLKPRLNLENLTGRFLILEGKNDELIPEAARARLRDAVPEPKTIVTFDGDHMGAGPDKAELLQKIIAASREWLVRTNAVNPL